jgi:starch phosphorylase
MAVSHSIRDRLIETFNDTNSYMHERDPKRIYYFSMEYLMGRFMQATLINLKLTTQYKKALFQIGFELESLFDYESDPGLVS